MTLEGSLGEGTVCCAMPWSLSRVMAWNTSIYWLQNCIALPDCQWRSPILHLLSYWHGTKICSIAREKKKKTIKMPPLHIWVWAKLEQMQFLNATFLLWWLIWQITTTEIRPHVTVSVFLWKIHLRIHPLGERRIEPSLYIQLQAV